MPHAIERAVLGDQIEPGFRLFGHTSKRPLLQRRYQRILHGVFGHRQVTRPERPREPGDHLPRLAAEQMLNKCNRVGCHGGRN